MKKPLIVLLSIFAMANANAATLTADAGWSTFSFGGTGSSWDDTFSFTVTQTSTLTVTDAFASGDIFEIFANSSSLGLTSTPTGVQGSAIGNDYDAAAASSDWSTGLWQILAGSYTVSGIASSSPFGSGQGALRLDTVVSAVPIPTALLLFAPALLGFLGLRRKA